MSNNEKEKKDFDLVGYFFAYIGIVVLLMYLYKERGGFVSGPNLGETSPIEWNEVFQRIPEILIISFVIIISIYFIIKIGSR